MRNVSGKRSVRKRRKARRKKQLLLFLSVFLCVLLTGSIALMTIYAIRMNDLGDGLNQLANDSEQMLIQAFPFGIEGEQKVEPSKPTGKYADILADPEKMKEQNIYAKDTVNEDSVTMIFAGDIMFDDSYTIMNHYKNKGSDITQCMSSDLIDEMRNADIFMINNECTFTTRGTPIPDKTYTFRGKPEHVKILNDIGADIVSLANNHAYDYGEVSLLDSMDTLQNASIPYVGAGRNIEEASKPVYFIANDIKIAFLSATQIERVDNPDTRGATESAAGVFRCKDSTALRKAIAEAKANSDFVVVYVHWGTENEKTIDWAQKEQAPLYVEAGADLIIGDHPHCLQEIAYIGDVPIIYSLGNFWFNSKTVDTGMVKVTINKEGIQQYQFVPCLQSGCETILLNDNEKARVLQTMRELSPGVTIDENGYVSK